MNCDISCDILCLFSDMMSGYVYYTVIDEYHLYVFWMTVKNFQFTPVRKVNKEMDWCQLLCVVPSSIWGQYL